MTLKELLIHLQDTAIKEKLVNYSKSFTTLAQFNEDTIKDYSALIFQPSNNDSIREQTTTFHITMYYIDRLLDDESNSIDIISSATEVLKDMIAFLRKDEMIIDVNAEQNINFFFEREKFADNCGGAYTDIYITVANENICSSI